MDGNGVRQRKFAPLLPTTPPDAGNLRPCLVHVPTGEVINSYAQLSKLVKKLGWKVFVDVTGNVWSAWYIPAGDACFIQMVFLPHPHISSATYYQLSAVVHALGASSFNITYAPLRKFQDLEVYSDFHKPTLRVRDNGREVFTVRALTQVLTQNGWRKGSDHQFIKRESSEMSPIDLFSVIKLPSVESIHQLSALDLEYIVLNTENIFYLHSPTRYQPPRRQENKLAQQKSARGNSVTMGTTSTSPQTTPATPTAGKATVDFPSESSKAEVFY